MADERFAASLQLSVLAALCFDAGYGAAIASQVRPEHFDNLWRDFAARVLAYRKRYGKPPGENYLDDLAAQATVGKDSTLLKKRLLPELLIEAEGLNAEYTATRVQDFVRRQVLKGAVLEAGSRFGQDDEKLVVDIEGILHKALRFRQQTLDSGTFLNDPAGLKFLDQQSEVIPLGIPELDKHRIGLTRKELLLYIGPKGTGKTWFCVHAGKQALLQRFKVVHISLEMSEDQIIGRYYQSLFGIATSSERYNKTTLEFDDLGRLSGFKTKLVKSREERLKSGERIRLDFTQPGIKKYLREKMQGFGVRLANLVVKDFPTSSLTIDQLIGYLDYLEEVERFVPDVLIVDYPKLMKTDTRDLRISIGRNMEELRGIGGARNMAVLAPHQGTRSTIGSKRTRSKDAGEDISVVQTADTTLAYSRTEAEERLGLGRISVEHARKARGGNIILLSQSYETGQYVLNSALMSQAYWDKLKAVGGEDDDEE